MGLKEDMKEMYRRLGIMEERIRQLPSLDIPKKGDVDKDLAKAKDQKDFEKKKKNWQTKLDKAAANVTDADSAIESFADAVKKVKTTNWRQYDDNAFLTTIDDRIQQMEGADKALKQTGQQPVYQKKIAVLQAQRQEFIDRRKQLVKEVNQEIDAMWQLMGDANSKYSSVKRDVDGEKDALKNAKFGAGAKSKVKAGKK